MAACLRGSRLAGWTNQPGSYNYYQGRGNGEAMNGDFDAAILDWSKAEHLDTDAIKSCRGEFQRVQIRAANDAKARMIMQRLTKAQAAAWFERHQSALWIPDKCDMP